MPLILPLAYAIIKDMNFHQRPDNQPTPQKSKSDGSPNTKRIRLSSPLRTNTPTAQPENVQQGTTKYFVKPKSEISDDIDDVYFS